MPRQVEPISRIAKDFAYIYRYYFPDKIKYCRKATKCSWEFVIRVNDTHWIDIQLSNPRRDKWNIGLRSIKYTTYASTSLTGIFGLLYQCSVLMKHVQ